jgi:hypothetical protein
MILSIRDLPTSKPWVGQSPYKFSFETLPQVYRAIASVLADAIMGSIRPHSASIRKSDTERYRRKASRDIVFP